MASATTRPAYAKASAGLRPVQTVQLSFADYRQFNESVYQQTLEAAGRLQGRRILHLNSSTDSGGGVAELLRSQIPFEIDLGLKSSWAVIEPADPAFFEVTKKIHNLLQGAEGELSSSEQSLYEEQSLLIAEALRSFLASAPADIIVAHDPQTLFAVATLTTGARTILRLHVDLCTPNKTVTGYLAEHISKFNHVIISRQDCALPYLPKEGTTAIAPAIDPLAPKNQPLPLKQAKQVLDQHGIDTDRPIISQVSRFDRWKDPLGVIDAYRQAKEKMPSLQLLLVGFNTAVDDPDAAAHIPLVKERAGTDPDIHIFHDVRQLQDTDNDTFINAVQVASNIILQKSIREGFGLTVAEAMWKEVPVIGGDAGGIRLQITDGVSGYLVASPPEAAERILTLLQDPDLARKIGSAGRLSVADRYLMSRYVFENLRVYSKALSL